MKGILTLPANTFCVLKDRKGKTMKTFKSLEQGSYFVNAGTIETTKRPLNKVFALPELSPLPEPERQAPGKINRLEFLEKNGLTHIVIDYDGKKASVTVENRFRSPARTYEFVFVVGHELGHLFYRDETKADLFGLHFALRHGIDPRLIDFDFILQSEERKRKIKQLWKV